ncbi:MAG: lytic transglycosylase domain-containing protein [Acidimicrobiales bacterium]
MAADHNPRNRGRLAVLAALAAVLLGAGAAAIALWPTIVGRETATAVEPDRDGDTGPSDQDGTIDESEPTTIGSDQATDPGREPEPEGEAAASAGAEPESQPATPDTEPPLEPFELPLPADGPSMVAALDEAEMTVRSPDLTNAQLDGWGRRQQSLYRHLSFHPEWADVVLAGVDREIRNAVALNWEARQNLSALVNTETRHEELPAWRVVTPLPPQTLIEYYKQAEADHGIQWEFLAGINLVETRMGRIEGISTAGAIGPMQFLPTTWAECCDGDPAVPADAIAGAAKYLTIRGGPENMNRAIFGYNNSDYYVDAVTAYATVMMENERAYYGYHAWEIYFLSTEGLIRIPVGYEQLEPIPATTWLERHPETLFSG